METTTTPARNAKGQLLPGHTANPYGRPKRKTIRDYYTEEEIEDLINKLKQAETSDMVRTALEYIFGKPRQNIGLDGGEEGNPIIVKKIIYGDNDSSPVHSSPLPNPDTASDSKFEI